MWGSVVGLLLCWQFLEQSLLQLPGGRDRRQTVRQRGEVSLCFGESLQCLGVLVGQAVKDFLSHKLGLAQDIQKQFGAEGISIHEFGPPCC